MKTRKVLVHVGVASTLLWTVAAIADPYSWNGGDGLWSVSSMWTPNGTPGAADTVSFAASQSQTVTVDANAASYSANINTLAADVRQTFSILPGVTLSLDTLGFSATAANDVTVNGGGTLSVTNAQLDISGAEYPTVLTVSGSGTVLEKKKSDLCIGTKVLEYKDSPDLLHVTDGATVRAPNYTCVGNAIPGNNGSRGRLIIDGGASFLSTGFIYIGRGYSASPGCACAVTNASLQARIIDVGNGGNALFAGKNASIDVVEVIAFPRTDTYSWNTMMMFEDSIIKAPTFKALAGSANYGSVYSTGSLVRCSLDCTVFDGAGARVRDSLFGMYDSSLTCTTFKVGMSLSSNSMIRLVRTATAARDFWIGYSNVVDTAVAVEGGSVAVEKFRVGSERTAKGARYEQTGGTFTAFTEMFSGCYDSERCGARFKAVDLTATNVVCGDNSVGGLRPVDDYLEFADMVRMNVSRLRVGLGSIGAHLTITNSTVAVSCPDTTDANSTIVGRDAGATRNVMTLADSTLNQTGGNVFVGLNSHATNNTLRLVNSTFNFTTVNSQGDVIVGKSANANGNRLELLDHSTFTYDRNWISIGHNGSSNVLSVAGGSLFVVTGSNPTLNVGYNTGSYGNRLELNGEGSVSVKKLSMKYNGVISVSGTGNTLTLTDNIAYTSGCSFEFFPGAAASDTPMLTINKPFPYSSSVPLVLDFSTAGFGRHVLVSSSSEVAEPVVGSNVILKNQPRRFVVRVSRLADGKGLACTIMPKGIVIDFK